MALAVWQGTITDEAGNIQSNATVEVLLESTGAVASIYSDRDGATPLSNPSTDADGYIRFYAAGGAYRITATKAGGSRVFRHVAIGLFGEQDVARDDQFYYRQTSAELSAGVTPVAYVYPELDIRRYGAVGDDSTDCLAAFDAAIATAREIDGSTVYVPPGIYRTSGTIALYNGVRLMGEAFSGAGSISSTIRYTGGGFVDVIATADSSQSDSIQLLKLRILGGGTATGTARYGFYAQNFLRGCKIENCIIRECYGIIYLGESYYSRVNHNQFGPVTRTQTGGGASDAQFAQVYGLTVAPVYFGRANGANLSHNVFQQIVSQAITATQAWQAINVWGQAVNCRNWIIESTGIDIGGNSPRTTYLIRAQGIVDLSGLYQEGNNVTSYNVYAIHQAVVKVDGFILYNCKGNVCFYNDSFADMVVSNGKAYRMDFTRAWLNLTSGHGVGGMVKFDNVSWMSGERITDASVNADGDNVLDTFGTNNVYGAADGVIVRFHARRNFPRVVTGLAVTNGSDANGPYVQVTGGVFLSEFGNYVLVKWRTHEDDIANGNLAAQRLRPNVAGRNWRVWIGQHGGAYLEESSPSFTELRGDWIASFTTDGSGAIAGLTANPRISRRGTYIPGTSVASSAHRQSFTANDATPSVANGCYFVTANSSATTVTALDDPQFTGHEITIEIGDANTTVDFSGTTLKGNGGSDWTPANGDFMRCIWNGTNWKCSVHDATP